MKYIITLIICFFAALPRAHAQADYVWQSGSHGSNFVNVKQETRGEPVDSSQQIADRIVESKIPVLVDFWAGWCTPCKILDPIIESLQKEYSGRVLFIKVDVDVHKALSAYFKVSAIPSVFIIEDKTVRSAFPGVRGKRDYALALDKALELTASRAAEKKGGCSECAAKDKESSRSGNQL